MTRRLLAYPFAAVFLAAAAVAAQYGLIRETAAGHPVQAVISGISEAAFLLSLALRRPG